MACELVARDPARANLVARLPGTGGGPSLMLLGHTDVVPAVAADWTRTTRSVAILTRRATSGGAARST